MSAPIRVLQIIDSMMVGGAEMLLYEFVSELDPSVRMAHLLTNFKN
jgi:hypothetical protein